MRISRRDLGKLIVAAPVAAALAPAGFAKINSKIGGVMVGAQTYSFRDRDLDACIAAMKDIGLGYAELWQGHLEPSDRTDRKHDAELKKAWRANPPMDQIDAARQKFEDAGIEIYALNYSFRTNMSGEEIQTGFLLAQTLGTTRITASANVDTAAKIDPFAEKYKTYVGMHNHDSMRPNEFSTPDDFASAMKDRSKYIKINLDIGHFTAAGFDPVQFLEEHHEDILTLHIKDRKTNHGANMPFGQGETNIKEVLQLLKANKYPIPANIEYEYGKQGMDSAAEVGKCFEYMKQALA
jgi:sugar phosphate isomerase/epimerase